MENQKPEKTQLLKRKKNQEEKSLLKKQKNVQYWLPKDVWFIIFGKISIYYALLCKTLSKEWNQIMTEYQNRVVERKIEALWKRDFYLLMEDFLQRPDFENLKINFIFADLEIFEKAAKYHCLTVFKTYHEKPIFFKRIGLFSFIATSHFEEKEKKFQIYINDNENNHKTTFYAINETNLDCLKFIFSHHVPSKHRYGILGSYFSCLRHAIEFNLYQSLKIMLNDYRNHALSMEKKKKLMLFALKLGNFPIVFLFQKKIITIPEWRYIDRPLFSFLDAAEKGKNLDSFRLLFTKSNYGHRAIEYCIRENLYMNWLKKSIEKEKKDFPFLCCNVRDMEHENAKEFQKYLDEQNIGKDCKMCQSPFIKYR